MRFSESNCLHRTVYEQTPVDLARDPKIIIKCVLIFLTDMHPIKTIFFILTLCFFVSCAITFQSHAVEIIDWIDDLGWFAPVLFIISYSLATILFLPTMVLTLAGGALFGPLFGTTLNLIGATIGAVVSFLITRHLIYDWFNRKRGPRIDKLITDVNKKGWLVVAFLRLFPVIPFNLVNYGLGLTGIPFRIYLSVTITFLIPAEIIYTYFGYAGRNVLTNPSQFYKSGGIVLLVLALLFLVVTHWFKYKQLKKTTKDISQYNPTLEN